MIDADTMKVLAVVITDESEGDGAQLKESKRLGAIYFNQVIKKN